MDVIAYQGADIAWPVARRRGLGTVFDPCGGAIHDPAAHQPQKGNHMFRTRPVRSPLRKIATGLSALALALAAMTAAAVPARASNDDFAKFVLGATALVIIGKAISDKDKRRHAAQPVSPPVYYHQPQRPPVYHHPHQPRPPVYHHPHRPPVANHPVHRPPHHGRPHQVHLPASCAIRISHGGPVYYSDACLRQNGLSQRLPNSCARTVRMQAGSRTVYDGACLQNAGYRRDPRLR